MVPQWLAWPGFSGLVADPCPPQRVLDLTALAVGQSGRSQGEMRVGQLVETWRLSAHDPTRNRLDPVEAELPPVRLGEP